MDYIAMSSDLMFRSKIREAAGPIAVTFVKNPATLTEALATEGDKTVIFDLNCTGIDVESTVRSVVSSDRVSKCVCYCSHVDEASMEAARKAGATEILPRSKFINVLPSLFRQQERGVGNLTLLIFGSILFSALYYAYHVLPFYYYFYELQNNMETIIRVADTETDAVIRRRLKGTIKNLGIPVDPEKLLIDRKDRTMRIQLKYQEVFYITWRGKDYTIQVFDFDAHAVGTF